MTAPDDRLDPGRIYDALDEATRAAVHELDVMAVVDSTNDRLRERPPPTPGRLTVLLAEFQTAGRGRRGRSWLSQPGAGVCLSVSRAFGAEPPGFPALGLAAGVAVRRGLEASGIPAPALKWPNDIIAGGRKLAGVLVDAFNAPAGVVGAVIGVGINVARAPALPEDADCDAALPPVAVHDLLSADHPSRSDIAAQVICALRAVLDDFAAGRFGDIVEEWRRHDALVGHRVAIRNGGDIRDGIARGIDSDGALVLETGGGPVTVTSGDVSVRPVG